MFATGMASFSRLAAYGMGMSAPVTRSTWLGLRLGLGIGFGLGLGIGFGLWLGFGFGLGLGLCHAHLVCLPLLAVHVRYP